MTLAIVYVARALVVVKNDAKLCRLNESHVWKANPLIVTNIMQT